MVDTDSGGPLIKDRLNLLRQRRHRLDSLKWTHTRTQLIDGLCTSCQCALGILAVTKERGEFEVVSVTHETETRRVHALNFAARNFVMDLTQDVVIFLTPDSQYVYIHVHEN